VFVNIARAVFTLFVRVGVEFNNSTWSASVFDLGNSKWYTYFHTYSRLKTCKPLLSIISEADFGATITSLIRSANKNCTGKYTNNPKTEAKYNKTKRHRFNCLLRHLVRKRDGIIT